MARPGPRSVDLPIRPFLYTPDQIAGLLSMSLQQVYDSYLFYAEMDNGVPPKDRMKAHNIAGPNERPEWRIAEQELIRWMRHKGFRVFDRSHAKD